MYAIGIANKSDSGYAHEQIQRYGAVHVLESSARCESTRRSWKAPAGRLAYLSRLNTFALVIQHALNDIGCYLQVLADIGAQKCKGKLPYTPGVMMT